MSLIRTILATLAGVVCFVLVAAVALGAGLLTPIAAALAVIAGVVAVGLILHDPHHADRREPPGFR